MKRYVALLLMLLLLPCGCAKTPTVKVGIIEPLSGGYAAGGQLEYQGICQAHQEFSWVGESRIELVPADNASSEEGARTAAQQLVDAGVSVVVGSWGTPLSQAASEVFAKHNIPAVATNARVTNNNSYFSVAFTEAEQGQVLAQLAQEMGWQRVAILYNEKENYDIALRNAFIEAAGVDVIGAQGIYPPDCADFTDYVAAMEREQVDALLVPSAADAVVGLTQLPVMGGDVCQADGVYRAVYGPVSDVGYDGYLLALALLDGATEVEGRTGRFVYTEGCWRRTSLPIQTPNGIEKKQLTR